MGSFSHTEELVLAWQSGTKLCTHGSFVSHLHFVQEPMNQCSFAVLCSSAAVQDVSVPLGKYLLSS